MREDWTPHRRDDGELVGWIRPEGELWVPIDLLGHVIAEPGEWLEAEYALEQRGIAHLAGVWLLGRSDGRDIRVKLVEVTPERIVVQTDDFGAIDVPITSFVLAWPAPPELRPA